LTETKDSSTIVEEELRGSLLERWRDPIQAMAQKVLQMPLIDGCSLRQAVGTRVEMEFFFAQQSRFFKGFVDLVFVWNGHIYLADWKTNWLGPDEAAYSELALHQAMDRNNYWLQASLYATALQKAWPHTPLGGAVYLFLRGIHSPGRGILFFQPKPFNFNEH
jgi:ATP-dependent exoDNAse (exonuclease V) beta subunit